MPNERLSFILQVQAEACERLGAGFTGGLVRQARADYDAGGVVTPLFEPWKDATRHTIVYDGAPIRLVGALHDLALSGEAPSLAAHYPANGSPGDAAAAWAEAVRLIPDRTEALSRFMAHEPQTNEVGRSACLLGGFLTIARDTGLPLRLIELGASAGLNQQWDRFHYTLGSVGWGDEGAAVRLAPEWTGGLPPLDAAVRVLERSACDRRPVDLTDPVQRRRLQAYVWPDQPGRLPRLRAAIALALANPAPVETADAVDFARARAAPKPGAVSVLFHSVFWQYMPDASQAVLRDVIAAHGAAATPDAPFAWLRMEPPPRDMASMEVRLTLWPTGEERLLAVVHPHGAQVQWCG